MGIKYTPPNQLPEKNLSEQEFQKWKTELEMYLSMEDKFALFFPGQPCAEWRAGEEGEQRIAEIPAGVPREKTLLLLNTHLKVFLSLIAKCVSDGHHATVMNYSTSLNWIFEELRKDYNIQAKGIHFLNLIVRGGLWAANEKPGFPEHSEKTANRKAALAPARVSSCI